MYSVRAWGVLSILFTVVAVSLSSGNVIVFIIFFWLFLPALFIKNRISLSRRTERKLSLLALIPLVLEQMFTGIPLLNSLAHCLLIMEAIKVYKYNSKSEMYIIFFTGFAVIILAASTANSDLIAIPMVLYGITTAIIIRQFRFGINNFSRAGNFHFVKALVMVFIIASTIALVIPSIHRYTTNMVANYFGESIGVYTAFTGRSTFGDVGKMKTNNRVVLRIFSDNSLRWLRGKIFVRYTKYGWRADSRKAREIFPSEWIKRSAYRPIIPQEYGSYFGLIPYQKFYVKSLQRARIILGAQTHRTLFVPYNAIGIQCKLPIVYSDHRGSIYRKASLEELEYITYSVPRRIMVNLKGSSLLVPGAFQERKEVTTIPEYLVPQLKKLCREIVGDQSKPQIVAMLMKNWLTRNFKYSTQLVPTGEKDPVQVFLFGRKEGNCEMFASALTLLLRTQDIPARYVTGFLVREKNRLGNYYIVRERDAHAWCEMFLQGYGWMLLDSTPTTIEEMLDNPWMAAWLVHGIDYVKMKSREIKTKAESMELKTFLTWIGSQGIKLFKKLQARMYKIITIFLLAITIIFIVKHVYSYLAKKRKKAFVAEPVDPLVLYSINQQDSSRLEVLRELFYKLESLLQNEGITRKNHQTFWEFLNELKWKGITTSYIDFYDLLVQNYYLSRFGNKNIEKEQLEKLAGQWEELVESSRPITDPQDA